MTDNAYIQPRDPNAGVITSAGTGIDNNKDALNVVLKLWEQGKSYRKPYDKFWPEYLNFYNGKQWPEQASKLKARPNVNLIRATVQTILPIMTDTSPGFNVVAQEPQDYDFSRMMDALLAHWWSKNQMDLTITTPILSSLLFDVGYLKVIWDPKRNKGRGDVAAINVNPEDLWVPESARSFDEKCPWVIQRLYLTKAELKKLFPEKSSIIDRLTNGKERDDDNNVDLTPDTRNPEKWKPPENEAPGSAIITGQSSNIVSDSDGIELLECWIKEDNRIRVITIAHKDRVVLQDKNSPYADDYFPFVRFIDAIRPDSFFGEGEVGPLVEVQKMINKNFSIILNHQNLMSNPTWVVDTNSGVKPSMLTNEIGLIINKKPGSEVRREQAPSLPPQIHENYNVLRQLMDTMSGVHDVTQGRKPTGVTAASAIENLQDAAQTRIRLKDRNLQTSLYRLGELVVSRILQYYTQPRVIRTVGDQGKAYPKYYEIYVAKGKDGKQYYAKRTHQWNKGAEIYAVDEWKKEPISGDLDLVVKTGTSLPLERNNQRSLAMQLYKMKVIDKRELLDRLEINNADSILQRMEQEPEQPQEGM